MAKGHDTIPLRDIKTSNQNGSEEKKLRPSVLIGGGALTSPAQSPTLTMTRQSEHAIYT
jgi:hypothetical protein